VGFFLERFMGSKEAADAWIAGAAGREKRDRRDWLPACVAAQAPPVVRATEEEARAALLAAVLRFATELAGGAAAELVSQRLELEVTAAVRAAVDAELYRLGLGKGDAWEPGT
jgi:hypothetical protein